MERHTGDPFSRCYPIPRKSIILPVGHFIFNRNIKFAAPQPTIATPVRVNPCLPSPCGLNSECRDVGGSPSCSCKFGYMGSPPNCRPECVINSECSYNKACIRGKCADPCQGSCGTNAECAVFNHTPMCTCPEGFTGDPFSNCYPKPTRKIINCCCYLTLDRIVCSCRTRQIGSLQPLTLRCKHTMP